VQIRSTLGSKGVLRGFVSLIGLRVHFLHTRIHCWQR